MIRLNSKFLKAHKSVKFLIIPHSALNCVLSLIMLYMCVYCVNCVVLNICVRVKRTWSKQRTKNVHKGFYTSWIVTYKSLCQIRRACVSTTRGELAKPILLYYCDRWMYFINVFDVLYPHNHGHCYKYTRGKVFENISVCVVTLTILYIILVTCFK